MNGSEPNRGKFSETMRIDLPPDALTGVAPRRRKRGMVVAPSARRELEARRHSPVSETERLYHDLLNSLYDAAVLTDLSGSIVEVNWRAEEFLHAGEGDLRSRHILEILLGADSTVLDQIIGNLHEERFTLIQAYCQRLDGSVFPAEVAVNKLPLGDMRLCFFIRDVTRRRDAEEALITEHNAIQNAGAAICVTDAERRITYLNPAMLALFGLQDADQMLRRDLCEVLPDRGSIEGLLETAMQRAESSWGCEIEMPGAEGVMRHLQVTAACNRDTEGAATGVVLSLVDVSDRKKAETSARQVERQRVMLESLGAACHHLGQPATVLLANLSQIRKHTAGKSTELDDLVESCVEAIRRLSQVLHRLNQVNEYRTTQYLQGDAESATADCRILDIEDDDVRPPG